MKGRVLRVRHGVKEQKCVECGCWLQLKPELWRKRSSRANPIGTKCVECERRRHYEISVERRAERRAARPNYRHMRILHAPGNPVWQYRDLQCTHIDDMLEACILPEGTKLMDYDRRQFIVRENGDGQEMAELPPERWHEFSAPNVRVDCE